MGYQLEYGVFYGRNLKRKRIIPYIKGGKSIKMLNGFIDNTARRPSGRLGKMMHSIYITYQFFTWMPAKIT